MTNGHPMKNAEHLAHLIVEFYEKLSSWEHAVVKGKGLTLPQMHALELLGAHGPLRMKELADRMGVTTGTLTALADRLETKDLIRRAPNKEDRRSYLVELTDKGRERFLEHDKLHLRITREITAGFSQEEADGLCAALSKMNGAF